MENKTRRCGLVLAVVSAVLFSIYVAMNSGLGSLVTVPEKGRSESKITKTYKQLENIFRNHYWMMKLDMVFLDGTRVRFPLFRALPGTTLDGSHIYIFHVLNDVLKKNVTAVSVNEQAVDWKAKKGKNQMILQINKKEIFFIGKKGFGATFKSVAAIPRFVKKGIIVYQENSISKVFYKGIAAPLVKLSDQKYQESPLLQLGMICQKQAVYQIIIELNPITFVPEMMFLWNGEKVGGTSITQCENGKAMSIKIMVRSRVGNNKLEIVSRLFSDVEYKKIVIQEKY